MLPGASRNRQLRLFSTVLQRSLYKARTILSGTPESDSGKGIAPREFDCVARGLRFRVLEWGEGDDVVVLLHGLNSNAWVWARVAQRLGSRFRVLVPNLRAHGGSEITPDGHGIEDAGYDVVALLEQWGVHRFHLAGHSWGGKIATVLAARHPQRVLSLQLADPVPPRGFNPVVARAPFLADSAFEPERRHYPNERALLSARKGTMYDSNGDALDLRLWREHFVQKADGSFVPVLPEAIFQHLLTHELQSDISPLLPQVACPVHLMLPTFTVAFLPGETRAWREGLGKRLSISRIPGDHQFIHTNPAATLASMLGHLPPESSSRSHDP